MSWTTSLGRPSISFTGEFRIPNTRRLLKVSAYNSFSISIKVLTTFSWVFLNNPAFLGFYTLLGTPANMIQMVFVATELAFPEIPALSREEEARVIRSALLIDGLLIAIASVALTGFSFLSHAKILQEIGGFYFLSLFCLFLEPVNAAAGYSSIARERTRWYFALSNARPVALVVLLGFSVGIKSFTLSSAAAIYAIYSVAGLIVSLIYFHRMKVDLFKRGLSGWFIENFKKRFGQILAYRVGRIAFSSFSALYILFLADPTQVGIFGFAWTISNLTQLAVQPVLQQAYGPQISLLLRKASSLEAHRLAFRSAVIALGLSIFLAVGIFVGLPWVLRILGKSGFAGSTAVLLPLLVYQGAISVSFGFAHYLYASARFRRSAMIYMLSAAVGAGWLAIFRQSGQKIESFPAMGITLVILSFAGTLVPGGKGSKRGLVPLESPWVS